MKTLLKIIKLLPFKVYNTPLDMGLGKSLSNASEDSGLVVHVEGGGERIAHGKLQVGEHDPVRHKFF